MDDGARIGAVAAITDETECQCYINAADIRQGQEQVDPIVCTQRCKLQFLGIVSTGWVESSGWEEGCRALNESEPIREFWSLYWCDETFCGVRINQTGGLGQDPGVDFIINTCQNNGFTSILDPGPPPPGFKCNTDSNAAGRCSATVLQIPETTQLPQSSIAPLEVSSSTVPTATNTQPGNIPVAVPPGSTSETSTATMGVATTGASTTSGSSLSGQGIAAVAVCSTLALIALVCFALLWLRRRKRRRSSFQRALRSHDAPATDSPTPLISPTSSAIGRSSIMTPPLRLRDRKFLPSILRPGSRSPSPPLTPLTPAYSPQPGGGHGSTAFPYSPICSPTINKLIPRHEGTLRSHAYHTHNHRPISPSPTFFSLPIPVPGGSISGSRTSGSTYSDGGVAAAAPSTAHSSLRQHEIPISIAIPSLTPTTIITNNNHITPMNNNIRTYTPPPPPPPPPGSPFRPPRPHDTPLEIPDLLTPASVAPPPLSPPPNRALPRPPPLSSSSRGMGSGVGSPAFCRGDGNGGGNGKGVKSSAPVVMRGGATFYHQGRGQAGPVLSVRAGGGMEERKEKEGDARGSWGSWSGTREKGKREMVEVSPRTSGSSSKGTEAGVSRMPSLREEGGLPLSSGGRI